MYNKDSVEIYQEVDFGKRTTAKYVLLSKANCIMETRLNPRNAFHVYLFEDPLWILTSKELASCLFCSPALTERTMLVKNQVYSGAAIFSECTCNNGFVFLRQHSKCRGTCCFYHLNKGH